MTKLEKITFCLNCTYLLGGDGINLKSVLNELGKLSNEALDEEYERLKYLLDSEVT
jgi:hypothetical protein